ncbi:enoyl-CoA hydratase [Limobrevibacterium gyesilva]|uniref:Enoyl-CoA hydratase n=1 Tax=Limobrevibacterium gyesilva TaxID=2991712 RepID=A0AA42CDL2_9PROT|nr:enoyl-CoA hydratase [Limobrevibacterium gyesilva]MCW3474034.1 enoyl-CoA hydratase [Limobrevibacterium gyesilva]
MTQHIEVATLSREGGRVARVTVCNPARLNVIGTPLMDGLIDAFTSLAVQEDLRVVVLAGEGPRAMIGGADINEMAGLDPARGRAFITRLHAVCTAVRSLPVPVIARMQGYSLGGGLEIAAACDLRIAAAAAKFGMPEVKIGIPSVIEAALLPQLIGWGRTRRLLYTGETIDAPTALAWGLVEEVVADAELDAAIERVVADILACGPRAIRLQKALIREWEDLTPAHAIERGIDCFEEAWRSDEPTQRMAAFLAARKRRHTSGP